MKLEIYIEEEYKFKISYYFTIINSTFGSKIALKHLPINIMSIYTK